MTRSTLAATRQGLGNTTSTSTPDQGSWPTVTQVQEVCGVWWAAFRVSVVTVQSPRCTATSWARWLNMVERDSTGAPIRWATTTLRITGSGGYELELPKTKTSINVQLMHRSEPVSPAFQHGVVQVARWTTAYSPDRDNRAVVDAKHRLTSLAVDCHNGCRRPTSW